MSELIDLLVFAKSDSLPTDGFVAGILYFLVIIQGIAWVVFLFILPFSLISILNGINGKLRRGNE